MDRLIVACVQQRMRLSQTIEEYIDDLRRFMRVAEKKNARLIVFPELGGVMVMPPLLQDFRSSLLKRSDKGKRPNATLWQKVAGSISTSAASFLRADFDRSMAALLDVEAEKVRQVYIEVYGGLAREFGMTVVAPSAYLPDGLDGIIRNNASVFGTNGELLGSQGKVVLHPDDTGFAQSSSAWDVIQTQVGGIGIMIGGDVMYPEVGRLLAYQGAEILIGMAACAEPALYNKVRSGMLARMQDNQLFGLSSFLVGDTTLSSGKRKRFLGKSAIFAPQELSPRFNGILVEMGNQRSEGVITAEWNFNELRELWETSDTPVRRNMPLEQTGQLLAQLYERLQQLPRIAEVSMVSELPLLEEDALLIDEEDEPRSEDHIFSLDDLPVLSSVTSRWPLSAGGDLSVSVVEDYVEIAGMQQLGERDIDPNVNRSEDETDEMDALAE